MRLRSLPEFHISKRYLLILFACLNLVYCGQNYNSNSDDNVTDIGIDCTANPRLCLAYAAIRKNHCFQCHQWAGYKTDTAWENDPNGLIIIGSPSTSMLVTRLKNSGSSMPLTYGPLSSDDYNAIVNWIQNL